MMIGGLTTMLAVMSAAAFETTSSCSLVQTDSRKPRDVFELSLRSTTDSTQDLRPFATAADQTGHRARLPWDTAAVYGQVFQVLRVDGDAISSRLQNASQVVLVWWRLGLQCQRLSPMPAIRLDVQDLFIVARPTPRERDDATRAQIVADLRPDSQWIGGMPTLDVTAGSLMYSPTGRRPANAPVTAMQRALTVPEYREFFALLPVYGASYEQNLDSWRRLLRWAAADPERFSLYPASIALCLAQINTGARKPPETCAP